MITRISTLTHRIYSLTIVDVLRFSIENILSTEKYKKFSNKVLTPEKYDYYIQNFIENNSLSPQLKAKETRNLYYSLNQETYKDLGKKLFLEKDQAIVDDPSFVNDLIKELNNTIDLIYIYSDPIAFDYQSNNPSNKVLLYNLSQIFEKICEIIIKSESNLNFIKGLTVLQTSSIPKNEQEFDAIINKYKFFNKLIIEIRKIIDKHDEIINEKEFYDTFLHVPTILDVENNIKEIFDRNLPVTTTINEIHEIENKYLAIQIMEIIYNQEIIPELVSFITMKDAFRPMIKDLITFNCEQVKANYIAFKEAIEKKIELAKQKRLPFKDWEYPVIMKLPIYFERYLLEEQIINTIAADFNDIYNNYINNYKISTEKKLGLLEEIISSKEKYSNSELIHGWRLSYNQFQSEPANVLAQLFEENYFENEPILYFYILYTCTSKNYFQLHNNVIKNYKENKRLRFYAIETICIRISHDHQPERLESVKRIYRESFLNVLSSKETLEYRLELFDLLINHLTTSEPPPYPEALQDLSDIYIQIMKKLFESADEHSRKAEKKLKNTTVTDYQLLKEILNKQYYYLIISKFSITEFQKDLMKRKIELRLGNDYKAIEEEHSQRKF